MFLTSLIFFGCNFDFKKDERLKVKIEIKECEKKRYRE